MDSATKETPDVEYEPNNVVSNGSKWTGKLNSTKEFVWNSSKREFIGRTWSSWGKIGLFYFTFYTCLAIFFGIMLGGFFGTLDTRVPTQTGLYSLIKQNPGMGFRPMVETDNTLLKFKQGIPSEYKKYVDNINSFLTVYYDQKEGNVINCSTKTPDVDRGEVCNVKQILENTKECHSDTDYGYFEGMPCVILKINNVYDWKPKNFTADEIIDERDVHAKAAKKALGVNTTDDLMNMNTSYTDHVLVTCEGETDADQESLGKVSFYPKSGFPFHFYPYRNHPGYRQPIVFAKFTEIKSGRLIQVWCKAWARNIMHHTNDRAGSSIVSFNEQVSRKGPGD